jgi:hypothetical protein
MNSVTEVIPTFFAGLLLGYLVYKTGSIAASMATHFAFNASALFINGSLGLSSLRSIPLWFHFASIGGILFTILLLSRLKSAEDIAENTAKAAAEDNVGNIVKAAAEDTPEAYAGKNVADNAEAANVPVIKKYSAGSIVLFVLSGLFVIIIGAIELYVRQRI